MSAVWAEVGPGFAQPVHHAQQVFRAVLEAIARPGRVQILPAAALHGLDFAGLGRGLAAVLLCLLDAETSLWLDPALRSEPALAQLRFHTGVSIVADAAQAAFAATDAALADVALWHTLNHGSDAVPQDGATLLVEVPSLQAGLPLTLRGPGIADTQVLHVGGLGAGFWQARAALEAGFPRGIELILASGDRIAALPRTTRVSLEG